MKKMHTYKSHGDSQGGLTKQLVHADIETNGQNTILNNSKNKTMTKKATMKINKVITTTLLLVAILFTALLSGCQKEDSFQQQELRSKASLEDVSQVSLQRLAQMQYDPTLDESLYDDVQNRITSLSQQEHDEYLSYWIAFGIQRLIDKDLIAEKDRDTETKREYEKRRKYDEKSKEIYNVPMYKLDLNQQIEVLEALKTHPEIEK